MVFVTSLMMIFVVPAFKNVFTSFGADLPWPMRRVIDMSDFFVKYWWLLLMGSVGGGYFLYQSWRRSPRVQMLVDRALLRPPVLETIIILVLGVIIGSIVVAIYLPIFMLGQVV